MRQGNAGIWRRPFMVAAILLALIATGHATAGSDLERVRDAIRRAGAEWTAGPTSVSVLSREEQEQLCGTILERAPADEKIDVPIPLDAPPLPSQFDWRDHEGADWTTPIRNQGPCGSCWAFSAVGVFEALLNIDAEDPNLNKNLSEQYILSCCPWCGSCSGGWPWRAFDFMTGQGTVEEDCMPYQADDSIPCEDVCSNPTYYPLYDWAYINEYVENFKRAIYYYGPISACFRVYEDFYYYTGGVYEHVWGGYRGGHAIVIVGWDDAEQAWICKNSWGTGWGEDGWFRIGWGECGIQEYSTTMASIAGFPTGVVNVTVLDEAGDGVPHVSIYVDDDWMGETGPDGTLALGLIDGMNYNIFASSYGPPLLLHGTVTAPGSLVLDCRDAAHVTVTASKRDGSPLDASLYVESSMSSRLYGVSATPGGSGEFYITPGYYGLHVWSRLSEVERYNLAFPNSDFTDSRTLTINAQTMATARGTLDTFSGPFDAYGAILFHQELHFGRSWELDQGDSLIVNAGAWGASSYLRAASGPSHTWWYYSWLGSFQVTGGEEFHFEAGGDLTLSTWPEFSEYYQGADGVRIWVELADDYGNSYDWISVRHDDPEGDAPQIYVRPDDEVGPRRREESPTATWDNPRPWLTVTPPSGPDPIYDGAASLDWWTWIGLEHDAEFGTYTILGTQETHLGEREAESFFDLVEPDPDPYEPNDTCEEAYDVGTIGYDTPFTSEVADFLDPNEDWFRFFVQEEGLLLIQVQRIGVDALPFMWLYDACGADPLASAAGFRPRVLYHATPGTYYLRLDQYEHWGYGPATQYTFSISLFRIPAIEVIGPDPLQLTVPLGAVSEFHNLFELKNTGQPGSELSYRILWQDVADAPEGGEEPSTEALALRSRIPEDLGEAAPQADPPMGEWDLLWEDPHEPGDSLMDFARIYAQIDGTTLYFKGVVHTPWTSRPGDVYANIVLDVDQDTTTGASIGGLGVDYSLVFGCGFGMLEGTDGETWWRVGPLDYHYMPADSDTFVVGVHLDRLGFSDRPRASVEGGIDLRFYGYDWGLELQDIAPDYGPVTYPPEVAQVRALPHAGVLLAGESEQIGLRVDATDPGFAGTHHIRLYFTSNDGTVTPTRDIIITAEEVAETHFRIERETGDVLTPGAFYGSGFHAGSADLAEWVEVSEPVEPGHVLEIDPEGIGQYRLARGPCTPAVAGVVSTAPGMVLGSLTTHHPQPTTHHPPPTTHALLALLGVVPVRVTDEGGPIAVGDLLVVSSTPGHAMRWDPESGEPCGLVGKALEPYQEGVGVVLALLTQ